MIRKRSLTLIEVCIAFGVLAVCFTVVFSNLSSSSKLLAKTEEARLISMRKQYFMERIVSIVEHLTPDSLQVEEKKVGSETFPVLTFVYENGLDRERIFSGQRRGELELKEGQIILSTFSKEGDEMREEVLFPGVSTVSFDLKTPSVLRIEITDLAKQTLPFAFVTVPKKEKPVVS